MFRITALVVAMSVCIGLAGCRADHKAVAMQYQNDVNLEL